MLLQQEQVVDYLHQPSPEGTRCHPHKMKMLFVILHLCKQYPRHQSLQDLKFTPSFTVRHLTPSRNHS